MNKPFQEKYTPTTESFSVVNSVEMKGVEKYLVVSNKKENGWFVEDSESESLCKAGRSLCKSGSGNIIQQAKVRGVRFAVFCL